jgi:S1-C subfamily serine protease
MKIASKLAAAFLALTMLGTATSPSWAQPTFPAPIYQAPEYRALTSALGVLLGPAAGGGVAIFSIDNPRGLAARAGLEVGDLLASGNGRPINEAQDLIDIIRDAQRNQGGRIILIVKDVRTRRFARVALQV